MSATGRGQDNIVEKGNREINMKASYKLDGIRHKVFGELSRRHTVKVMVAVTGSIAVLLGAGWYFAPGQFESDSNIAPLGPTSRESSSETFRIREQLRQEDRQQDFQDMLRYWDRIKQQGEAETEIQSGDVTTNP